MPAPLPLADACQRYLLWSQRTRDLSPHSIRAYRGDLAALRRYVGPSVAVGQLDHAAVSGFLDAQRDAGLAPTSVRRRAVAVRGFCRWLLGEQLLRADPFDGIEVPVVRRRSLPRAITLQESAALLGGLRLSSTASTAWFAERPSQATTLVAVVVMLETGMRVGELVALRVDDLDLATGQVRVLGKGRRERTVYLSNAWARDALAAYLQVRAGESVAHDRLLFNRFGEPLSTAAMRQRLATAGRRAHLKRPVTPHMLRHTAATQLLEAGADIRIIQRLLGHASVTTTEIYAHVSDVTLQRAISDADVLGRALMPR